MSSGALDVTGSCWRFGENQALDGVSFHIDLGERIALLSRCCRKVDLVERLLT